MSGALHLTLTTPMALLVDDASVTSLRAEDESGAFGILPGHTDLLTALPASVLRWRDGDGARHYCAIRGGLMTVTGGARVAIACRDGILGDDLPTLEARVRDLRAAELEAERKGRVEQTRLHTQAVRRMMRYMRAGHAVAMEHPPGVPGGPKGEAG